MKPLNKLSLLFVFFINFYFTQNHAFLSYPKFEESDLKKPYSLIEKNAPAEILYTSVSYKISERLTVEKKYFSKIKIYDKKNSEEWLNIEIPITKEQDLSDFEVNVYNYSNNKVEKKTINKREQLKENFVEGLKIYKLAIPNVLDGSVIEYHYKIETNNGSNLAYNLQYSIPVVYEEYNFEYPSSMVYIFNNTGTYIKPIYNVSIIEDHLGVGYNVYRFGYENMKSVQQELFVKDNERYRAKVKPELKKYSTKYFTYDSAENWNKVAERLSNNDNFGGFLKTNVKDVLPEDIKTFYNPLERANKIFEFVKNSYKWNKEYGIITSQSFRQLLKTKSGNAADINLLLIAFFRNAGLKADPLLISTVDNGILNIISPNLNDVNLVLAAIRINEQIYFYDATSFNSKVNMLPERDWNDFGILIDGNKGTDLSFSNTNISKKDLVVKADIDVENNIINGTFLQKESGLYAIESYDEYDINNEKYKQSLKSKFGVDLKDVESKLFSNGDFESQMKFSTNTSIDIVGNKIILNPLLFLNKAIEIFDQKEERKNQIDFISAFVREKRVEIAIPNGYKVSDMPKPKKISTDDKEISYFYNVEVQNNKLIVTSKIDVLSQNYPKEYYPFFKQIWKIVSENENQVISLIKN